MSHEMLASLARALSEHIHAFTKYSAKTSISRANHFSLLTNADVILFPRPPDTAFIRAKVTYVTKRLPSGQYTFHKTQIAEFMMISIISTICS